MNKAIRPNTFVNVPSLERETAKSGVTDEEMDFYSMAKSAGWQRFEKIAREAISDLGGMNRVAISKGAPIEEIGRNAIVVDLAQGVIERLLNIVIDATEACTKDEGK